MELIEFQTPSYTDQYVYIQADRIQRETEKAICFSIQGSYLWFPRSAITFKDNIWMIKSWFKFCPSQYEIFKKVCRNI